MDIDATQAIDWSDFDDETDEKTDELERSPVGYLKVFSNKGFQETAFPVYEGENFIGRDVTNSIAIPVKSLSKQHACIEVQADTHLMYDLGSRNKTRKGKLFLKPNVRYNIQHDDKIMLADMSCQYCFANQYEKSHKQNDSGSDTDSDLMLGDVDLDASPLLPQVEDLKESENSDSPNLSDCIQPTQAVKSDSRSHGNETLQMKTPAALKAGGVLAAESDNDSPKRNGAADISRVQESGSDTDVEAYANETEDFCVDGEDIAIAATQACNLQEPPTQPTNNAKATLTYDPDSEEESDNDTTRGRSLYEAETQAVPAGLPDSDEDKDDDAAAGKSLYEAETQVVQGDESDGDDDGDITRGRSLYEAETQVAPGGVSEDDSDGGDEVKGRSLFEAETQAVQGDVSESDDDEDGNAMQGGSLYEAATQALNLDEDSDDEKNSKKRVSIASTVPLDVSSDLESSGKKPRQSMSPTKTSLMKATKKRIETVLDELTENSYLKEATPTQLKDIKLGYSESEDTEFEKSEETKQTPFCQFEESTEETVPCSDVDFAEPTQEMLDSEDQKNASNQQKIAASTVDHFSPVNEIHSKKSTDAGLETVMESNDTSAVTSGEIPDKSDQNIPSEGNEKPALVRIGDLDAALVKRGEQGQFVGSETKLAEGRDISEKVGDVCSGSAVGAPTLQYDLHRSLSDKSKDSQESLSSENNKMAATPTVPYQLAKSLIESSCESKEDSMETLPLPVEGERTEVNLEEEGERLNTEETQAYGDDETESLGEAREGESREMTNVKLGDTGMDVDATQQYGEEEEEMVGNVGKTEQEVAMETEETQAYGDEDDDGVAATQVYGEDTQVPDSQEGEQAVAITEGDIQADNVFAEVGVVGDEGGNVDSKVEIDAAPQRRKSGDEGILKKRKGSIPSSSNDEKVSLISSLKKKVRFGKKNSATQSGVSTSSSRSSSRSSQSSVENKDEEFEVITGDDLLAGDEDGSPDNVSTDSTVKPLRESRASRKRKMGTVEKPDEEDVKKMKAVVDEESDLEKGGMDSADTEKDAGGGGRKSSRKRKTATIVKPDLSQLSSPESASKDEGDVTEVDSSIRRSRRKAAPKSKKEGQEAEEKDGNNNNTNRKTTGRSKVTVAEDDLSRVEADAGKDVKGSARQRKGKEPAARKEESSSKRSRRGKQSQQAEVADDITDNIRNVEEGDEENKEVETSLSVTSSIDENLSSTSKRNTRSLKGKAKKGEEMSNYWEKGGREHMKEEPQVAGRGIKRGRGKDNTTSDTKEKTSAGKEEETEVAPRTSRRGKRFGKDDESLPARKLSKKEEPLEERTGNEENEVCKEEDVLQRGGRRGRNKKEEVAITTPTSSRTRTRGKNLVSTDERGGVTSSLRGALKKDQKNDDDDDDTSESSSTLSLGMQSLPDSDATFVEPEPIKGKRGGRRKTPAVKVDDSKTSGSNIDHELKQGPSTLRRGRGQVGQNSNALNTPENTSSTPKHSRSSKSRSSGSSSKSPRSSPNQLDPGSSPSLRRRSGELKPKVMFTGVIDKSGEKIVSALGGELVDSVFHCTHLVTDKVRRTVKFLCCLSRGAIIVTPDWLEQSKIQQRFVDAKDFMLFDIDAERQHKFSLSNSYEKANKGALLSGWKVYTTPNVKPEPSQMKDIIRSAGGEILSRVPCQQQNHTVVISCEADSSKCLPAVAADIPIVTAEFLLTGLLRQEINVEEFRLSMAASSSPANTTTKPSTPTWKTRSRRR